MKQYWKKDIWFTVHAIERLIEEKDRKIFDSIDEGREKLKEYLAKPSKEWEITKYKELKRK